MKPFHVIISVEKPLQFAGCVVSYLGAAIIGIQALEELFTTGRLATSGKVEILSPFEAAALIGWLACVIATRFPFIKIGVAP